MFGQSTYSLSNQKVNALHQQCIMLNLPETYPETYKCVHSSVMYILSVFFSKGFEIDCRRQ